MLYFLKPFFRQQAPLFACLPGKGACCAKQVKENIFKKLWTIGLLEVIILDDNSICPVGQVVKTPPSHGGNRGSTPLRDTSVSHRHMAVGIFYVLQSHL